MNKQIIKIVAASTLVMGAASTQAQDWTQFGNYTDALIYQYYDNAVPPNALGPNANPNTWSSATGTGFPDRINGYTSDGDTATYGGFRWLDAASPYGNTGGGADRAYNGSLYFIRSDYSPIGSPDGYTHITGLNVGTTYTVAMFSVIGGSKDTVSYSLDYGTTWSSGSGIIDTASITPILGGGADWLEHSTTDAIGTPGVKDGDTRFRVIIGDQVATDDGFGGGEVIVGFRDPNLRSTGGSSDRGRMDGFAVAEGSVSQVPEPTTFALAGLSAAALLIFRRRS